MSRPTDGELLRMYLANRDVPCPRCGYNLRAMEDIRCPECGEAMRLSVGLIRPKLKAHIAGLIGLSAGAGLSGLLLLYAGILFLIEGLAPYMWTFIGLNSVGFLGLGGATAGWALAWRPLHRLNTPLRVALAGGCWGMTLIFLLIFTYVIR